MLKYWSFCELTVVEHLKNLWDYFGLKNMMHDAWFKFRRFNITQCQLSLCQVAQLFSRFFCLYINRFRREMKCFVPGPRAKRDIFKSTLVLGEKNE